MSNLQLAWKVSDFPLNSHFIGAAPPFRWAQPRSTKGPLRKAQPFRTSGGGAAPDRCIAFRKAVLGDVP